MHNLINDINEILQVINYINYFNKLYWIIITNIIINEDLQEGKIFINTISYTYYNYNIRNKKILYDINYL